MPTEKQILEEIVENTLKALRSAGFIVDNIVYPEDKRSIDIVGSYRGVKVIIKASVNTSKITSIEITDLKKASVAYNATPLIISRLHGKSEIEEDVVYSRRGINVVNEYTLQNYLVKNEKPLVKNIQGTYLVRINPEKFRKKRIELGYSLGEIASLIGVTRKAVYDYEHGRIAVRIDTALRIAEVLGEDVFEPIELLTSLREEPKNRIEGDTPRSPIEKLLYILSRRRGYTFYKLLRTPIDYILGGKNTPLSIIYKTRNRREFRFKIEQAEKISRTINTKPIIVREPSDVELIEEYFQDEEGGE